MSRRRIRLVVLLASGVALLCAIAVRLDTADVSAIVASTVVSGILVAVVRNLFVRKAALHSPHLYYVALAFSVAGGALMYTVLAPFPCLRPWHVRLLYSVIASASTVLSMILLARLMKVSILPWEQDDGLPRF